MTPESPVIAELRPLLEALCAESITTEQMRRLEGLLAAHPEAEAFYVQYMSFHADLIRTFSAMPVGGGPPAPQQPAPARAAGGATPGRPRAWRHRLLVGAAVGLSGVAAGLLIGFGLLRQSEPNNRGPEAVAEQTDDTVAVLLQTSRAEWEETGLPTRPGAPLPPGRLVLKSGHAQIEFYSGATVILEGPAEFQLVSRNKAYCARGKLRATVPPQAQGFAIGSPALDLIDRGTEFGLDVGGAKTEVHVFKGEVDLFDPGADPGQGPRRKLRDAEGLRLDGAGPGNPMAANPGAFLTAGQLADRSAADTAKRRAEWLKVSAEHRKDANAVVYFPFEPDPLAPRTLRDEARGRQAPRDGAVVGSSWGAGRWVGKQGLEFKKVSDRVRLTIPGEFRSLTLAAWVRPDALPNVNHSLLMADGWEEGEPHWQIGSDGTLILGIKGPPDYNPEPNVRGPQYRAPGVITPDRFGRWVHLAVVYDADAGEVVHYVDGQAAARSDVLLDLPLRIGDAEIGNWNAGAFRTKSPVRNFNGCIDEFLLLSRAMPADEVRRLAVRGRPPL